MCLKMPHYYHDEFWSQILDCATYYPNDIPSISISQIIIMFKKCIFYLFLFVKCNRAAVAKQYQLGFER